MCCLFPNFAGNFEGCIFKSKKIKFYFDALVMGAPYTIKPTRMNLYIRYFDEETLVSNAAEALHFLSSLDGVEVTEEMTGIPTLDQAGRHAVPYVSSMKITLH